jgi:hypothetical protein
VASVLYQAVNAHLSRLGIQQDIISVQYQYINRTQAGEAVIIIEEVKKGRAASNFHATLRQTPRGASQQPRKLVVAYFVCAAPSTTGLTLETGWELLPRPPPIDLQRLLRGEDPSWAAEASRVQISHLASLGWIRAVENAFESYYRRKPGRKGLEDAWIRLSSEEKFTNATLPFVADAKPYVVEGWRPTSHEQQTATAFARNDTFWYPTLVMNLDIKKLLPEEGVEWLFLRTEARKISGGRLDLQVTILDDGGDLVAVASHVNMILSSERNTGNSRVQGKL